MPSEEEVIAWFDSLSNWGRWGSEDFLGTVNLIDENKRLAAIQLAREGIVVSCSQTLRYERAADVNITPQHFMLGSGQIEPEAGSYGRTPVQDVFFLAPHGSTITHFDAPAHSLWRSDPSRPRTMYNGHPQELVTIHGAKGGSSIETLQNGVVTRGVLLDIPGLLGIDWLEPGTPIFPEDLEAAERRQGVTVTAGDVLMVRTGHIRRRASVGPADPPDAWAGLQAACLPWLRERDVAVLACDVPQDVAPKQYPKIGFPIHAVGMVAMGMWMLDNADHERLLETCQRLGRWEFLFVAAPLKLEFGTGSPVNPLAVF